MKATIRIFYLLGFIALSVAALYAFITNYEGWISEPIYQACFFIMVSISVLWGISEVILRFSQSLNLHLILLVSTIAAVVIPTIYLLNAAFYGTANAQMDTWHLLSMFALIHQALGTIVVTVVGFFLALITTVIKAVIRK